MLAILRQRTKSPSCRLVGIVAVLGTLATGLVLACDTPVYRYAMYRWEPAPYEVYCFHDKPLDEQAGQIQKLIESAGRSEQSPANVLFVPVALNTDPELKKVPPDVRKVWQDSKERQLPSYLVVTPHGQKLYQGALDEALIKSMLDSPVRAEIARLLAEGKAGVMIFLTGSDEAANAVAEKEAKTLIADVAAGKAELYLTPGMSETAEDGQSPAADRLEFGLVKLARADAAEKWLVDSLLSIESDLTSEEFAAQPMVFPVFGRGRALPPFVGKGITRDNLLECVYFLSGACSCTIKDQNPGLDLLFAVDWWSAVEKLASAFGAEEGNEAQLGAVQLFPSLIIPGGLDMAESAQEAGDTPPEPSSAKPVEEPAESAPNAAGTGKRPAVAKEQAAAKMDGPPTAEDKPPEPADKPSADASPDEPPRAAPPESPPAAQPADAAPADAQPGPQRTDAIGAFPLGIGLCVVLVLLFGATFLMLRPK